MAQRKTRRRDFGSLLGASKSRSCLLVLFVPSHDRHKKPIDQGDWVHRSLETMGRLFGGATAYPKGRGVWRDDDQGGRLLMDEPVIIQCYTSEVEIVRQAKPLREFLIRMGNECQQGAVGFVIDREYLEIKFPLTPKG